MAELDLTEARRLCALELERAPHSATFLALAEALGMPTPPALDEVVERLRRHGLDILSYGHGDEIDLGTMRYAEAVELLDKLDYHPYPLKADSLQDVPR